MMRALLAAMVALLADPVSAGLPLKTGAYVMSDTPCKDPPFAAMMGYDGKGLTGRMPHNADRMCWQSTVIAIA